MDINTRLSKLNEAIQLNNNKEYDKAETIIDELIENIEIVEIDQYGKVLDFSNEVEFVFYCQGQEKDSNISWNRNYNTDIYLNKAIILYEKGEHKKANLYLKKALRWNPVRIQVYCEILENYIKLNNVEKFKKYFNEAIKKAMTPLELAILYRKYAFFCIDRHEYELAYNLLLYTKLMLPRKEADSEIDYLSHKVRVPLKKWPDIGTVDYIRENELEYKVNRTVIVTYASLAKHYEEELVKGETEDTYVKLISYYELLYFFNKDEKIHSLLIDVMRKYNNYKSKKENKI